VLLKSGYQAAEIKKEIGYLKQLEALGIKTPRRYKIDLHVAFSAGYFGSF
jgi:hypothetical protein